MKSLIMFFVFVSTSMAFAEIKQEVSVSEVNFDGKKLSVVYQMSGGCQDHEARIEVTVSKAPKSLAVAEVKVFDISSAEDMCEALFMQSAEINLSAEISKKLEEAGIEGNTVKIQLPQVVTTID